ncbi:MAG: GAF domain-containing protein [Solirubrobacteraceae bacterium]
MAQHEMAQEEVASHANGTKTQDNGRLRRLLTCGRSLLSELDPQTVLDRILQEARAATGARYAALGVLNEQRTELEQFLTLGVDQATSRAIGTPPRGRGVLGALITHPEPVRLHEIGTHAESYGFPAAHPVMHGFLGVPIMIRGQAWGNLYLADKHGGQAFTADDQEAVVILAEWAATAIENARLYKRSEEARRALEQAVQGLEAARDIADATGGAFDLDRILELIAKRGRALVSARCVLIMLRNGSELVVSASAGDALSAPGRRLAISKSTSGEVFERGCSERIADVRHRLRSAPEALGVRDARTALLVPMMYHGSALGVLAAFDRGPAAEPFTSADEQMLRTFAASAANAVTISRSVEADRLRSAIAAAEAERRRWARELHDETLQALGGLRVLLASALRRKDPVTNTHAMNQAIADIEHEIESLRAIITDLRPSLLDDLGLLPAIEALIERRRADGLDIVSELSLPAPAGAGGVIAPELETTVYRLVQEALTNVVKHACASLVHVAVRLDDDHMIVEVQDNGVGFDTEAETVGFGLAGMRERIYLAGGTFELKSDQSGTLLRASIAVNLAEALAGSRFDELAS